MGCRTSHYVELFWGHVYKNLTQQQPNNQRDKQLATSQGDEEHLTQSYQRRIFIRRLVTAEQLEAAFCYAFGDVDEMNSEELDGVNESEDEFPRFTRLV